MKIDSITGGIASAAKGAWNHVKSSPQNFLQTATHGSSAGQGFGEEIGRQIATKMKSIQGVTDAIAGCADKSIGSIIGLLTRGLTKISGATS